MHNCNVTVLLQIRRARRSIRDPAPGPRRRDPDPVHGIGEHPLLYRPKRQLSSTALSVFRLDSFGQKTQE